MALSGIAGAWRVNEKEDDQPSNTNLAEFMAAFLDKFSVQTSTVENVKAMADLRQGPTKRVVDYLERCRTVVTAWGREHKAAFADDQTDRKAGFQDCLTLCIKQQFVAGLKPAIRQVIESKYASLTTRTLLLKAVREAEIAVSTGPDKWIVDIEQELSALRLAQGAGRGSSPGRGGGQSGAGCGHGSGRGGGQGSQSSVQNPGQSQSQAGESGLSHKKRSNLGRIGSSTISVGSGASIGLTSVSSLLPNSRS